MPQCTYACAVLSCWTPSSALKECGVVTPAGGRVRLHNEAYGKTSRGRLIQFPSSWLCELEKLLPPQNPHPAPDTKMKTEMLRSSFVCEFLISFFFRFCVIQKVWWYFEFFSSCSLKFKCFIKIGPDITRKILHGIRNCE